MSIAPSGDPTIRLIQRVVASRLAVPMADLLSARRDARTADARQVAMWLARHMTGCSLPTIGAAFGRDHTTVLHGIRRIAWVAGHNAERAAGLMVLHAAVLMAREAEEFHDQRVMAFLGLAPTPRTPGLGGWRCDP